jgi:hypothetical protein
MLETRRIRHYSEKKLCLYIYFGVEAASAATSAVAAEVNENFRFILYCETFPVFQIFICAIFLTTVMAVYANGKKL